MLRFTTDTKALIDAAALAKRATPAKGSPLPVLSGLHLDATVGWDRVVLTGSDLDRAVRVEMPAEVTGKGRAVLPARLLLDLARIADKGYGVTISGGREEVTFEEADSVVTIDALPLDDYPVLPRPPAGRGVPFDTEALIGVLPAVCPDDDRPVITGVRFDGCHIVATDSYRLHIVTLPEPHGIDALIPGTALAETVGMRDATIRLDDRNAWIRSGRIEWSTRLIEGQFPNWRQLVPASQPVAATFNPHEVKRVLAKVAKLASANTPVRVTLGADGLTLAAITQDVGKSTSKPIPVSDVELPFGEFTSAYNPEYLADALTWPKDVTAIAYGAIDALKPAVLHRTDDVGRLHRRLLMPIRVS